MGVRDALLWPVYRLAGWTDEKPLSAAGAVVALGASVRVFVSAVVGAGGYPARSVALETAVEAALAQPAYVVVTLVGLAVFLLYDG